jgi:hypothetical protein
MWQTIIHLAFVVSALAIAYTEKLFCEDEGTQFKNIEQFVKFALNQKNAELNQEAIALNTQNAAKNQVYNQVVSTASTTQGGDYVPKRDGLLNNSLQQLANVGASQSDLNEFKNSIEQNYKLFYLTHNSLSISL